MRKKLRNSIVACALALAMVAGITSPGLTSVVDGGVAKAEVHGDEGAGGLNKIDKLTISSPNERIRVQIWNDNSGTFYYSAYLDNYVVLKCAKFGIKTEGADLSTGMSLDEGSITTESGVNDYKLIQGPVNYVNNEYNDLIFTLKKGNAAIKMTFRVQDEGMAYCYEIDGDTTRDNESLVLTSEESYFQLPDGTTYWTTDESRTYEAGRYTQRSTDQMRSHGWSLSTPALCSTGNAGNGAWVLLSEAAVYHRPDTYCASVFESSSGSTAIKVRWGGSLNGEQDKNNHGAQMPRQHTQITRLYFTDKATTPWRAAIIGQDLNAVTTSTLIYDLNPEPYEGYDFSWVEPGTSVWSWWSTFSDAIDYDSMFDYIDFCHEMGITYCLVDYGWELWPDYESKVATLVEYADERNVGLLLWYGVHKWDARHIFDLDNYEDIETQMAWCEKMGVKGVKVDYIESDSQFTMNNMYMIIESAARHKQVVNFHGATDPNGECRTFPNLLSTEAVCGMEYFKWSDASAPETLVTLPFTRNVIGSMEYTPTLMQHPRSPATSGFMLSMCINYESAVSTFAQSGYVYPGYIAVPLIADVPSTWDETRVIDGYPRSHVIMARRNGENWYLGAMTVAAENYEVPLDFLEDGVTYHAYIYRDNSDGSALEFEETTVTSADTMDLDLLQYGGAAVKFTKDDPIKYTEYDSYTFYEAEDAKLGGNTSISSGQAAASGMKTVENITGSSENRVTFDVEVPEDGIYKIRAYIISAEQRNLVFDINGEEQIELSGVIGISGDWGAVRHTEEITANLYAGSNTIALYVNSGNGPNIDRISVSKPRIDDEAVATLSQESYIYDGSECKPDVTLTSDTRTYIENENYSVFYSKYDEVGTAKVYIRGINGYGGQIVKEYSIEAPATPAPAVTQAPAGPTVTHTADAPAAPKAVKIKSAKSTAKKKIVVKWKKIKGANGYQITYSTNKKFRKAKTINVKAKKVKYTIKKLKSGKKYFIKVRAYKLNGKEKVTGAWSKVKVVKKVK